jgi:hypothetical protein
VTALSMEQAVRTAAMSGRPQIPLRLEVVERGDLVKFPHWQMAFAGERKDHRYYELIEDTLHPEFEYRYFILRDASGEVHAVEPFFVLDQDLLVGVTGRLNTLIEGIRRHWPRFMRMRTLMVGCVAGEGHLDDAEKRGRLLAEQLAALIADHARALGARLVVLKEFPSRYRSTLACFLDNGFSRIPSMPMTRLSIDYASFDDYAKHALSGSTRRDLRKKFRAAEEGAALEMSVVNDVTPFIREIYPLYLQVYERSNLHFEKLTEQYFCELGQRMEDKVRFFLWRRNGRIVAFATCMTQGDELYAEYIGLDYDIALNLHLYHYVYRDVVTWAIANGYKWFRSSGLNYDPKFHLRHLLDPLDLYVRHTSATINTVMKWLLPLLEPTRYDKTLAKFSNYHELWSIR